MNYWIAGGCPREKLILGMALYGRCFRLVDPDNNGIGAPANGPCKNGTYTREAGFLAYFEVALLCCILTCLYVYCSNREI